MTYNDFSITEDKDSIVIRYSLEPMRNNQRCTVCELFTYTSLDQGIGLHIDCAGGLYDRLVNKDSHRWNP